MMGSSLLLALSLSLAVETGSTSAAVASEAVNVAADAAPPQLSISVTDGQEQTSAGSDLTYTITVQNTGAADITGLLIDQTLPDGVVLVSADQAGTQQGSTVSWTIDAKTAASTTLSTKVTVGQTPPEVLRLATTVCALTAPDAAPIVCASDSDLLPAGAQAAKAVTDNPSESTAWMPWLVLAVITASVLLVIGVTGFVLVRRRRRRRR